jgi:hypothetical protein
MQPHCPNGHAYDAYHTNGTTANVSVGGRIVGTVPIYCNLCGHVYGVVSAPVPT